MMQAEFDVIVTDLRMPEINGAEFLRRSISYSPASARIVLSGQADERTILACLPYTHQHVAKPCDVPELVQRLTSVVQIGPSLLARPTRGKLTSMLRMPVQAKILARVREELSSASPSLGVINECIASDPGLSVKLLQLTNSFFFGHPDTIISPARAVGKLGVDTLRKVVLDAGVFEDLLLPKDQAPLEAFLEQTTANALMESAMEESYSADELLEKIARRCYLIGHICLAHQSAASGLDLRTEDLDEVGVAAGSYLMTVLGLPKSLIERAFGGSTPSGKGPSIEGASHAD